MRRTRIKICGICRGEDAAAAAAAGADAIGIVLHRQAARFVPPERVREILQAIGPFVTPVGLFVDVPPDEIRDIARSLGLRHVQLHGHEDADCVAALHDFAVLKAVRVDPASFVAELASWRSAIAEKNLTNLRGIVLESPSAAGGSGIVNDWQFIAECQARGEFRRLPPIIAAGGLTPGNVQAVVRGLRPWAVDVSSGVEVSKGIKSGGKIAAFMREAARGDAE